ncbi:hypothetical protein EJB05_44811, partial [Eragrostis curvula]
MTLRATYAGVPAALYWIQPAATVFAAALYSIGHLAGAPIARGVLARRSATCLRTSTSTGPRCSVNTFDALEPEALRGLQQLDVVAVGLAVLEDVVSRHSRDDNATGAESTLLHGVAGHQGLAVRGLRVVRELRPP